MTCIALSLKRGYIKLVFTYIILQLLDVKYVFFKIYDVKKNVTHNFGA